MDYTSQREVSVDYYMTKHITNKELFDEYDSLLDDVAKLDFGAALEKCDKCMEISLKNKMKCEFKILKELLSFSYQKSIKNEMPNNKKEYKYVKAHKK